MPHGTGTQNHDLIITCRYNWQVCKACSSHQTPIIPYGTGTGLEGGIAAVQVTILHQYIIIIFVIIIIIIILIIITIIIIIVIFIFREVSVSM